MNITVAIDKANLDIAIGRSMVSHNYQAWQSKAHN